MQQQLVSKAAKHFCLFYFRTHEKREKAKKKQLWPLLQLLEGHAHGVQEIKDYTCTFIKKYER